MIFLLWSTTREVMNRQPQSLYLYIFWKLMWHCYLPLSSTEESYRFTSTWVRVNSSFAILGSTIPLTIMSDHVSHSFSGNEWPRSVRQAVHYALKPSLSVTNSSKHTALTTLHLIALVLGGGRVAHDCRPSITDLNRLFLTPTVFRLRPLTAHTISASVALAMSDHNSWITVRCQIT